MNLNAEETTIVSLSKIHSGRGIDGLSRYDREQSARYNRTQALLDKFLHTRKKQHTLQLTHTHILKIGDETLRKLELGSGRPFSSSGNNEIALRREIEKLENEVNAYKEELKSNYQKQFDEAQKELKQGYELLMDRIEKQRDEAEEERMKDLIRKMNDECELALKKQWARAEELRKKTIDDMRDQMRKELYEEFKLEMQNAIQQALLRAEEEFKKRELEAIERTRLKCEEESNEKIRQLCERYDKSIEALLQKIIEYEDKYKRERALRQRFESDFRLLQADYKRFMNYTNHYNSDYMMKLRHIGVNLIEDTEYEHKLDEKLAQIKKN